MSKFGWILEDAKKSFEEGIDWISFHNRYFSQGSKFMPKKRKEREEYLESPEFGEIQDMAYELEKRQPGITEPGGKLTLRLPRSLHRALIKEADREGTSLNQLILSKLAVSLNKLVE
jgi:predicted HicB family RNase H-like nuclease